MAVVVFTIFRSAMSERVSVSVAILLSGVGSIPLRPSSDIDAVFRSWVLPAGIGFSTLTANTLVAVMPLVRLPIASVQIELGVIPAQTQAGSDRVESKVVLTGTVSLS